jgi:hypothetical protein
MPIQSFERAGVLNNAPDLLAGVISLYPDEPGGDHEYRDPFGQFEIPSSSK